MLQYMPELRRLLVRRRIVHKMFDMIKCEAWETLISTSAYKEQKLLVLRDCYLTFDMISDPAFLEELLNNLYYTFQKHLKNCDKCHYQGQMCKICMDNKRLI